MVMDKGLGLRAASDLVESAGHLIDFLKLGFGTSYVSRKVKEKVRLYQDADIRVYLGGTLLEAFLVRGRLDDYIRYAEGLGCDAAEVSDGCIRIAPEEKYATIERLARHFTVVSEVGAKDADVQIEATSWLEAMQNELAAGSQFVIGEARESGTVGLYDKDGSADACLIQKILTGVPAEKIIWEAPLKAQQCWFIQKLGPQVNLGNIAPAEIVALETLRLGLRGDTFFRNLPEDFKRHKL